MKIQRKEKSSIRGEKTSPNHGQTKQAQGSKQAKGASKLDTTEHDTERKK